MPGIWSGTWKHFTGTRFRMSDLEREIKTLIVESLMLEGIEKTVLTGPLVPPWRPMFSPLHKTLHVAGRRYCEFEADPDPWRLSKLGVSALRG